MAKKSKPWYASKTVWYAIITGVVGVLASLQAQYPEIGGILIANSIAVAILRMLTEQPLGE